MFQSKTILMKIRSKFLSNKQHRLLSPPLSLAILTPILPLTATGNLSMLFHSFIQAKKNQLSLANKSTLSQFNFRLLPVVMIIIKLLLISMAMLLCDALPMSQTSINHRNRTTSTAGYFLQIQNNILDEYRKPKIRTKRFIASDIGAMVCIFKDILFSLLIISLR